MRDVARRVARAAPRTCAEHARIKGSAESAEARTCAAEESSDGCTRWTATSPALVRTRDALHSAAWSSLMYAGPSRADIAQERARYATPEAATATAEAKMGSLRTRSAAPCAIFRANAAAILTALCARVWTRGEPSALIFDGHERTKKVERVETV